MNSLLEHAPTAEAAEAQIAEEFAFFGDWTERYQYLIDLGRKLAPFPEALKTDAHKVTGCQSQVWLVPSGDARRLSTSGGRSRTRAMRSGSNFRRRAIRRSSRV